MFLEQCPPSAVRVFPFRSISPKRLKKFGGRVYQGTKVCLRKNRVDLTLKPKFPSAQYLLNESRFLILIFGVRMYRGTKVCRAKDLCWCNLWPWPSTWSGKEKVVFFLLFPGFLGGGYKCVTKICWCCFVRMISPITDLNKAITEL
jgi:hypothetical protein